MSFQAKMERIGFVAVVLGLLGVMAVAGGVEMLPPQAGFKEWFSLAGAAVTSLGLMLFGVSMINDNQE